MDSKGTTADAVTDAGATWPGVSASGIHWMEIPVSPPAKGTARHISFCAHGDNVYFPSAPH